MTDDRRWCGELSLLRQAWDAARRGESRVVGVVGVPGIGKTALVRRFAETVRPSTLLWVSGDEAEAGVPWGVVQQVIRGLREPVALRDPMAASADPAGVGHALASDLRRDADLMLIVDDAQWCDAPSMTALRVAARHLATDPVLVVVACRASAGTADLDALDDGWRRMLDSDRGTSIVLGGLLAADLPRLAVACGHPGLSPAGAARLHEHTGGHPLHVRHILERVPMRSIVYGVGPLPVPATIATPMASRLASCKPSTRDVVIAGAVLGSRFNLARVRDLLDGADVAESATEAIETGLVEEVPGTVGRDLAFTSILARSVVYHEAGRARRRELHRRAASHGQAEALRHRIAAADGPDERLAHDLEQAAQAHRVCAELAQAATHLLHALELTPAGPRRTPRLLAAVEAMLVVGDVATAMEYQGELADVEPSPWSEYVAGYQLLLAGRLVEARNRLDGASAMVPAGQPPAEPQPPDLRARIAIQQTMIGVLTLSYDEMVRHGATAAATAQEPWVASCAFFMRALGLGVAGRGAEALAGLADADMPGAVSGVDGLAVRGMIRLWTDDLAGARSDLTAALTRATRGEGLRAAQALGFLGEVEYRRGALDEAVLHTSVAVGDAEENHRVWDYALLHAQASYPLAAQGEWRQAEWHAEQASTWARRSGLPTDLMYAAASQAAVAQARGHPAWLIVAAERMEQVYPNREPGTHLVGPMRADALSQLGRAKEARDALDAFLARLSAADRASTRMSIARVRAQIAAAEGEHAEAIGHCAEAADHARTIGLALEAARIDLLAGTCHSAAGRRAAAERFLRSALDQFGRIGATAYVNQTMREADRVGLRLDPPAAPLAVLTNAERAVVTLACQGLSNRRIAESLVVSVKTVEFHLTNAFRRLNVSTRAELRRVVAEPEEGVQARSSRPAGAPFPE